MHTITIDYEGKTYNLLAEGPLRLIRDLELARILGMKRPRDIRQLIRRHLASLGAISRYRAAKIDTDGESPTRGRPDEGYDLTEEQALFVAAKAETDRATDILKLIIAVFLKAVRGELAPSPAQVDPVALELAVQRGVMLALATQGATMQDVVQRVVSAELDKRTGVLGPHAKRVRAILCQQADRASKGADRRSAEWNSIRSRRDSALRDVLGWRGRWDRCPRTLGEVENALAGLAKDLGPGVSSGSQLRLIGPAQ